jgi:hypothetical protein
MTDIWEQIIKTMEDRRAIGIETYGRPLTPFNGRNSLKDLKEELLDAIAYLTQLEEEFEHLKIKALQNKKDVT